MVLAPRGVVAAATATLVLLLAAAPSPADAVATLRDPGTAGQVSDPLVAALSLLAWLLAGWLLLAVLLTLAARAPGAAGPAAAAVARRVAPVAVRRAVEVALGLSVTVGGLAGPAAAAGLTADAEPRAVPVTSFDWGGSDRRADLDWPAPAGRGAGVVTSTAEDVVVVHAGDTLWGLAEQQLAERDGVAPTDEQTAAAWPSWWAANRDAVGDDPHLIRPGTGLRPPPEIPAG